MNNRHRILAVISNQGLLSKIEGLMQRRTLEIHHVSSGAGALVLAGNLRYELVIIESPLPDLEIRELLSAMRALDSVSVQAAFLVLRADGHLPPALAESTDTAIQILSVDAKAATIHDAVTDLLGVAARRSARLLVEVQVQVGHGPSRRLYQSQNLSQSGILLRGGLKLEPGAEVSFELSLPTGRAIRGRAVVARHTSAAEPVAGTALEFRSLGQDELAQLRSFVYAGLATDSEALPAAAEG